MRAMDSRLRGNDGQLALGAEAAACTVSVFGSIVISMVRGTPFWPGEPVKALCTKAGLTYGVACTLLVFCTVTSYSLRPEVLLMVTRSWRWYWCLTRSSTRVGP